MFVDEIYQVEIGAAKVAKSDGSRIWDIRFDFIVPVKDYNKINPVLHAAIDLFYKNDDSGFQNLQWHDKWSPMLMLFNEERNLLTESNSRKKCVELPEVEFKTKKIVCWKSVDIMTADGSDKDTERTLILQISARIPKTRTSTKLVERFVPGRSWCRLIVNQTDIFEGSDVDGGQGEKPNPDIGYVTGVLNAVNAADLGQTFNSSDELVEYLKTTGRTDQAQNTHLKKIVQTGSAGMPIATAVEGVVAIFKPRAILLCDAKDTDTIFDKINWAHFYCDILTQKSITLKGEKK
jgi:hypothetical protein